MTVLLSPDLAPSPSQVEPVLSFGMMDRAPTEMTTMRSLFGLRWWLLKSLPGSHHGDRIDVHPIGRGHHEPNQGRQTPQRF